jgi:uncharacterized protein (UPF0276 family)
VRRAIQRFEPALVSEHACWGHTGGEHFNDLLPLPYTDEAVRVLARHVGDAQDFLGRQLLIENVSAYVHFKHSRLTEWEFLAAVCAESGCALLLDVNNIYVSSRNLGIDAQAFLAGIPAGLVGEMHVAGHTRQGDVLIDDHGSRVCEEVWTLLGQAVSRFGAKPTVVEWDTDIPPLVTLVAEAARADQVIGERHGIAA